MCSIFRSEPVSAKRAVALPVLLVAAMVLAACSTGSIGDQLPKSIGGLPEGAPQRPAAQGSYPAVHDMPPPRSSTVLTEEEQKKLEEDLIAARDRTAGTKSKPAGSTRSK
jgi:hypothetical protein